MYNNVLPLILLGIKQENYQVTWAHTSSLNLSLVDLVIFR